MMFNERYANICLPDRLLICVTFHYVNDRLQFLRELSQHFASLAHRVSVFIVTNTCKTTELDEIHFLMNEVSVDHYEIVTPPVFGAPILVNLDTFRHIS